MNSDYLLWRTAIPERSISLGHVHVWRISLDENAPGMERLLGFLSPDEVVRARRFRFKKDQDRFIAARGTLRCILGFYLDQDPHQISFTYGANGKPLLTGSSGSHALRFNLSHSSAIALCAVTVHRDVGIDVECIRPHLAAEQIAAQFFSQKEISSLARLDKKGLRETFFRYWTRKEAVLKATGAGVSFPMDEVDVSLVSDQGFTPVLLPGEGKENTPWYVQDLFPAKGYAAAIAVEGVCSGLTCIHYSL